MINKNNSRLNCNYQIIKQLISLIFVITLVSTEVLIAQQDTTYIPDHNFEQALINQGIDTSGLDGMVITADINSLSSLYIINAGIDSLDGIEDFENLEVLNCSNNNIESLDLSSNLDIRNLDISSNQISAIDLSSNIRLKQLVCSSNYLDTLILSNNDSLSVLDCSGNMLKVLDISSDTLLTKISCSSNQLEELLIFSQDSLRFLDCSNNRLTTIDVSLTRYLQNLLCSQNQLDSLDLRSNVQLVFLDCSENRIKDLNIIENRYLNNLSCSHNQLSVLQLGADYDSLEVLSCSYNRLSLVDVSNMPILKHLDCASNQLTDLVLDSNVLLKSLDCSTNLIQNIDLSLNTILSSINISSNLIGSLDLSQDTSLTSLNCSDNQLQLLNISNLENDSISLFNSSGNPNLRCILVDDPVAAESYPGWFKDATASYQLVCIATTYIPDPTFEQFLIDKGCDTGVPDQYVQTSSIDTIKLLNISYLLIGDLTGIEDFSELEHLNCSGNLLTYLDLSQNLELNKLLCSFNTIEYLDLSNNSKLDSLDCSNNSLATLNLKDIQTGLDYLIAENNPLACIQVDDVASAQSNLDWSEPDPNLYSENCISCCQSYVPDDNFEQFLIDNGYDLGPLDGFVMTSSINTIIELDVSGMNISDLSGIEDFLALEKLDCSSNNITSIDISNLVFLKELDCTSNFLTTLDIESTDALISLKCGDNKLDSLNISSAHVSLDTLYCDGNKLSELEIPSGVGLVYLVCNSNNINSLNIEVKGELKLLHCSKNNIDTLSVSDYVILEDLACTENLLSELNLSLGHPALVRLDCSQNYISELGVINIPKLEKLNCSSNNITSITIDGITSGSLDTLICDNNQLENLDGVVIDMLKVLSVSSNKLENLNVSNKEFLVELRCDDNLLTTLETTGMDALTFLSCNNNSLTELRLSDNTNLSRLQIGNNKLELLETAPGSPVFELSASNNKLADIDLSNYSTLAILNIDNNLLEELDLSSSGLLIKLSCAGNSILSMNLSNNTLLTSLNASSNNLISLDIKNGSNEYLSSLIALNNPYLSCIEVDDPILAANNPDWMKDSIAVYNLNCHFNETYIPDSDFEQYLIDNGYDFTDPTYNIDNYVSTDSINSIIDLNISLQGIHDLTGLQDFIALETLNCSSNELGNIDLSSNDKLRKLNGSDNNLDTLDLVNNTILDTLDISQNEFQEIALNNLTALSSLNLDSNMLTDLDLTDNALLTNLSCKANLLYSLDLRNGNITSLLTLDATGNPDLTCIEVDDPGYATGAAGWLKDTGASYTTDCHYYETYVPDDQFEQVLIDMGYDYSSAEIPDDYIPSGRISSLTNLSLVNNGISDLTGIEDFDSLRILNCKNNHLTQLDFSSNALLTELNCSGNQLTGIDLLSNTALEKLDISNNSLSDIDLSNNIGLTEINCSSNGLTAFSIVQNPNLIEVECYSNEIFSLDANNGFNSDLLDFNMSDNPNLGCVLVDDPAAAEAYTTWIKDPWSTYRTICDDDDNDGITDLADSCKTTPYGNKVDLFGCSLFQLPYDNFTIQTTDETCRNENNGIINISAVDTYNYTAELTGNAGNNSYDFTNGIEIRNVWSGNYELCITIDEEASFIQCYNLIITEPEDLSVFTSINSSTETVLLQMNGGSSYTVNLNGSIIVTTEPLIELGLKKGENTIEVKANKECQGIYKETIFLSDDIVFYPNPFTDYFYVSTGTEGPQEFTINVFSYQGQLMISEKHTIHFSPVRIDASSLSAGIYIVSIITETGRSKFEIIKK